MLRGCDTYTLFLVIAWGLVYFIGGVTIGYFYGRSDRKAEKQLPRRDTAMAKGEE